MTCAATYCTCQNIELKDGPLSTDEEKHWTIRTLPVRLVHKEPLKERQTERTKERKIDKRKSERFYSHSHKSAAVHIHGLSVSNPLFNTAMDKFAHWQPLME